MKSKESSQFAQLRMATSVAIFMHSKERFVSMLKLVSLFILTVLISGCSHKPKPPHRPSNYAPMIAPAVLPPTVRDANDPASEPGSPTSPQIQQLPKASP